MFENDLVDWKSSNFFGGMALITAGGYGPLGRMRGNALLDFPVFRLCFWITYTFSL